MLASLPRAHHSMAHTLSLLTVPTLFSLKSSPLIKLRLHIRPSHPVIRSNISKYSFTIPSLSSLSKASTWVYLLSFQLHHLESRFTFAIILHHLGPNLVHIFYIPRLIHSTPRVFTGQIFPPVMSLKSLLPGW